jgi:hypothetical protein
LRCRLESRGLGLWLSMTDGRCKAFVVYVVSGRIDRMRPMAAVMVLMRGGKEGETGNREGIKFNGCLGVGRGWSGYGGMRNVNKNGKE